MLKITPEAEEQFKEALIWAVENDCIDRFSERLAYLHGYGRGGGKATRCWIGLDCPSTDFRNFAVHMEEAVNYDANKPEGERFEWRTMFHGGLIYHHHPEQKSEQHTWGVHT